MNARTLRLILEHVPDDLPVVIAGRGGGCVHVEDVRRHRLTRPRYGGLDEWPARLQLEGRTLWYEPEPEFELRGQFLRAAELMAELERDEAQVPTRAADQ